MNIINKILEKLDIQSFKSKLKEGKERLQKSFQDRLQQALPGEYQEQLQKKMKDNYKKIEQWVDAFSLRERVLVFITLIVGVYFFWSTVLFDYFLVGDVQIAKKVEELGQKKIMLAKQAESLSVAVSKDVRGEFQKRLQGLNEENKVLQEKVVEQLQQLVTPKDMIKIIKNIVYETKGLELITLESKGSKLLFDNKNQNKGAVVAPSLPIFDHGLQIEVIGEYFQILKFLENLESQQSKMLWGELSYEVMVYPKAKVSVFIHTLGLEEGWLGV